MTSSAGVWLLRSSDLFVENTLFYWGQRFGVRRSGRLLFMSQDELDLTVGVSKLRCKVSSKSSKTCDCCKDHKQRQINRQALMMLLFSSNGAANDNLIQFVIGH